MSGLRTDALIVGQSGFAAGPFTFALTPGETLALVGANGSGKSTLLRTLGGLVPTISGTVARTGVAALLPPPGTLTAPFAAAHMVALGRAARHRFAVTPGPETRAAVADALDRLGIAALGPQPFDRLSSGQQQLVLLARLLVQEAAVCLLDEPAATLDPAQAMKVEACIAALAAAGRVAIVATHNLAFARRADKVLTIGAGNAFGPPAEVLTEGRIAALYGAEIGACTLCGQSSAAMT